MLKKIFRFLGFWLPPLLWAAMIFKFSSGSVPSASDNFWLDFIIKKTGHIILFASLAALIYRGFIGYGMDRKKAAILSVVFSFLYGVSDEFHQMFTQGREAKPRDVVIDGFGASITMFLFYKYADKLPKRLTNFLSNIGII